MTVIMGMNSGSSFDGIDAVLAEIDIAPDGHPARPQFIDGLTYSWPDEVAHLVLKSFANELTIFELCRLNYVVGACYAEAANRLLDKRGLSPEAVEVIGVDGQTIYQEPPDRAKMNAVDESESLYHRWLSGGYPCGLQIGEPSLIAAHTNIITVSQFRPADHAFGGTGAPLMQYLDFVAFRDMSPALTLNIGGIANCQLANRDRSKMKAFDTGPGNVMLDHTARILFDRPYDADGSIAASGQIQPAMLEDLLQHPYFGRKPPRSAWRLDFGAGYADEMLKKYANLCPEDMMATFCAFSAEAIVRSITEYIPELSKIDVLIASGGGVRNKTLMQLIRERLPKHMRLTTSDEFGIPAQFKEAIKFATLGFATLNHLANNIPACSGASQFNILGKIALAPRFAQLSAKQS